MLELPSMEATAKGAIAPQERDFAILRGLYESRVMTVAHATSLYFEGRLEAARKRIQKIRKAGLVRDREREHNEPAVLQLTKKGFDCLKHSDQLAGYPIITDGEFESRSRVSSLTLRHELAVMDVKAALVAALSRQPSITIVECSTWPRLSQFSVRQPTADGYGGNEVIVKPDGVLCFRQKDADGTAEHYLFIEVDRGTESQRILAERAACYRAHYRNGGFARSRGGNHEDFEQYPFRVLAIFKTKERRNNAAERLLLIDPPIRTMVWLTTMPEVRRDPLSPIWVRPTDYQDAIAGTNLELSTPRHLGNYRRQVERDTIVDAAAVKHRLIE